MNMALRNRSRMTLTILAILIVAANVSTAFPQSKPLTFEDLMKFRTIHDVVISEDGTWLAYQLKPDRGDAEVVIRSVEIADEIRVERGKKPVISGDARWVAVAVSPPFEELEKDNKDKNGPKDGMALVATERGSVTLFDDVEKFAFSDDSRWLAYKRHEVKEENEGEEKDEKKTKVGTSLVLRDFVAGREEEIAFVIPPKSHGIGNNIAGTVPYVVILIGIGHNFVDVKKMGNIVKICGAAQVCGDRI